MIETAYNLYRRSSRQRHVQAQWSCPQHHHDYNTLPPCMVFNIILRSTAIPYEAIDHSPEEIAFSLYNTRFWLSWPVKISLTEGSITMTMKTRTTSTNIPSLISIPWFTRTRVEWVINSKNGISSHRQVIGKRRWTIIMRMTIIKTITMTIEIKTKKRILQTRRQRRPIHSFDTIRRISNDEGNSFRLYGEETSNF